MDEEPMRDRTRILLIDDHTLFRESLVRLLEAEAEFEVVARCATVAEGVQAMAGDAVDMVLLDYDLGEEVGTDLLSCLSGMGSSARVMMVTAGMGASSTLNAANAGVAGIVLKHSDPHHLMEAIRRVAAGETWWDTGVLGAGSSIMKGRAGEAGIAKALTARQREVLRGILDGLTNKEIAARMQASETSIKASIQELFSKAGVRTRGQLVRVAVERHSLEWLGEG
jgi:two-component system, NarL family, nitrate/nitrite response regulator NarL